jgi:hypothetical protein
MRPRIVLIGDSAIGNASSLNHPDVAAQLRGILLTHEIDARAVDGSTIRRIFDEQLRDLRDDDLVVLSAGGADALHQIQLIAVGDTGPHGLAERLSVFWEAAKSPKDLIARVLDHLVVIQKDFHWEYAKLLDVVVNGRRRVLCLTVYNPLFAGFGLTEELQGTAEAIVTLYNDVIQHEAIKRKCMILETRTVLLGQADYVSAIKPSALAGAKLADIVKRWAQAPHWAA